MSKGDEYAKVMRPILVLMYEAGAIGTAQTLHLDAIAENFGLQPAEAQSVMELLKEQGKVARPVAKHYRLTGPGFEEAERLSKSKNFTWVRPSAE